MANNDDKLKNSLFDSIDATQDLIPYIEKKIAQIDAKIEEFEIKKSNINKEIENGARTTKHRLHL